MMIWLAIGTAIGFIAARSIEKQERESNERLIRLFDCLDANLMQKDKIRESKKHQEDEIQ